MVSPPTRSAEPAPMMPLAWLTRMIFPSAMAALMSRVEVGEPSIGASSLLAVNGASLHTM
jgi:hypothetical protein